MIKIRHEIRRLIGLSELVVNKHLMKTVQVLPNIINLRLDFPRNLPPPPSGIDYRQIITFKQQETNSKKQRRFDTFNEYLRLALRIEQSYEKALAIQRHKSRL